MRKFSPYFTYMLVNQTSGMCGCSSLSGSELFSECSKVSSLVCTVSRHVMVFCKSGLFFFFINSPVVQSPCQTFDPLHPLQHM